MRCIRCEKSFFRKTEFYGRGDAGTAYAEREAIRTYTKTYFGKSVVSKDLQVALEEASGRDLSGMFEGWVF